MLSKRIEAEQISNNTVLFVENALYVSGISTILQSYCQNVKKVDIESLTSLNQTEMTYVCNVKQDDMEKKSQQVLLRDRSIKLIIIKNNLQYDEVNRLIHIGVKGICLTDIDDTYLINTVNQINNGHTFIDHRFTQKIIQENAYLRKLNERNIPPDDTKMKRLLTRREVEILQLLVKGYSNRQISNELFISDKTVKNHIANLLDKMEVQDRLNAVLTALKNNWVKLK